MLYKIAFTGTSGSGKTTLANWVADNFNIPFVSSSSADIKTPEDIEYLRSAFGFFGDGHEDVIKYSVQIPQFGIANQNILLARRMNLINKNQSFVMDRSPLDNLVYFINQCGFHSLVNDEYIMDFLLTCLQAWKGLTHVIYVKAVQPNGVENNGSRIPNQFYQHAIDAQFEYWFRKCFEGYSSPKTMVIDYWDLHRRKEELKNFIVNA